jgi:hypothetical protein
VQKKSPKSNKSKFVAKFVVKIRRQFVAKICRQDFQKLQKLQKVIKVKKVAKVKKSSLHSFVAKKQNS